MFYPSIEQKDILGTIVEHKEKNDGSKLKMTVIAPAGTGKSSTNLYLMDSIFGNKFCYLVFNSFMEKSFRQRIGFATTDFPMIDKENVETFTLHAYMRKVLSENFKDIGFDYLNGEVSAIHVQMLLKARGIEHDIGADTYSIAESFCGYTKEFFQGIVKTDEFLANNDKFPYASTSVLSGLRKMIETKGYKVEDIERDSILSSQVVKEIFNDFIEDIFKKDRLNTFLPHNVYYKYVYEKYNTENIFKKYDYVFVDEGQDIDEIIRAMISKSNANVITFGDDFQRINRFKGTINGLADDEAIKKNLSISYRLTADNALRTEAYLKIVGTSLGYKEEDIPSIYGHSKNKDAESVNKFHTCSIEEFFDKACKEIEKIDIDGHEIVIELLEKRSKIESSILNGHKGEFEKSVKGFLKDKDYKKFFDAILTHTTLYGSPNSGDSLLEFEDTKSAGKVEAIKKALEQEQSTNDVLRELYLVAKEYSFKLSKKERTEILLASGNYGFITRNNTKLVDTMRSFVLRIPTEKLNDIPLYNIMFNSSIEAKLEDIIKHRFNMQQKEKAMFFKSLETLSSSTASGLSLYSNYEYLNSIPIPAHIIQKLLNDPSLCDSLCTAPFIKIQGFSHSLSNYGVDGDEIREILANAVKSTKQKLTKKFGSEAANIEVTASDILENTTLKSIGRFMKFDTFLKSQVSLEEIEASGNNTLANLYKYSDIKNAAKNNPNIKLVGEGAVYNFHFSTAHGSKGLEFTNTFLANDIGVVNEELSIEEKRDEFNLAYVAITRTKNGLYFENGSDLSNTLDEVVDANYTRHYKCQMSDIYISETLASPSPYFTITSVGDDTGGVERKLSKNRVDFISEYYCYKDLVVITDTNGNFMDLMTKEQIAHGKKTGKIDNNVRQHYFVPCEKETFVREVQQMERTINTEQEALRLEAESMF